MGTLANSEDLDEMQHISSGFALFANIKTPIRAGQKCIIILEASKPEALKVQNGQSHTYCTNMNGKIFQNTTCTAIYRG